jgi:hypothetical protein
MPSRLEATKEAERTRKGNIVVNGLPSDNVGLS